ncbi:C-C chemokine receptor type 6-like [Poecilia formosa]|uniref:C-C chemokine receptor type 6-like n=1 Tax=Poecilia formosa TaxID=48698 RepID=UPI0007B82B3D|nr:PREDICTED: C-C chemokine receptor type 6-like [Poecilia formosa]
MNLSNDSISPAYEYYDTYIDYEPCSSSDNSVNVVVGPYIHSIICILGLVGNSLVILTYALYKRTKSMTDVYLLNVAIADLLFVLIVWFNGTEEEETTDPQYVCEFKFDDSTTAGIVKVAVPSTQLAIGFFLPLLIMIFCYTAIIITLQKARNFQRHKAVRVVMVVVLVFIACHLPYNLALLYETVRLFKHIDCEEQDSLHTAKSVLQTVAYLHCCLNPVLYAFISVKFRNHFRRIFQDLCCLGKKIITPRHLSIDGTNEDGTSFSM